MSGFHDKVVNCNSCSVERLRVCLSRGWYISAVRGINFSTVQVLLFKPIQVGLSLNPINTLMPLIV